MVARNYHPSMVFPFFRSKHSQVFWPSEYQVLEESINGFSTRVRDMDCPLCRSSGLWYNFEVLIVKSPASKGAFTSIFSSENLKEVYSFAAQYRAISLNFIQ